MSSRKREDRARYEDDESDSWHDSDDTNLSEEGSWFRRPDDGMIAGICAGMADYYQVSTLMARGVAITGALFMPQIIGIAYIVGIFILPTKRELMNGEAKDYSRRARKQAKKLRAQSRRARKRQRSDKAQYFSGDDVTRGSSTRRSSRRAAKNARRREGSAEVYGSEYEPQAAHVGQSVDSKRVMLKKYNEKFNNMDTRMRDLEKHVTSRQYDLAREIDSL